MISELETTTKTTYRIPTKEQFAFVEVVLETTGPVSEEIVRANYDSLTKAFQDGEGLTEPEWKKWLDEYVSTGTVADGADRWAQMNERQKWCVNEIKKARSRKGTRGEAEIN